MAFRLRTKPSDGSNGKVGEFLHWTDIPKQGFAVMRNERGEPLFVDDYGLSKPAAVQWF